MLLECNSDLGKESLDLRRSDSLSRRPPGEGLITAIAVGGTIVILGIVFLLTPDLPDKIVSFFQDLTSRSYPLSAGSTIVLPGPGNPEGHAAFYTGLMQFTIGIGILQLIILPLRLYFHSRIGRIAETGGNLVFWFGAAFLVSTFLLAGTLSGWFEFWGALIVLIGVSIVVRVAVYFAAKR